MAALADAVRATPLERWTAADPYLALLVHRAVLDARAAADDARARRAAHRARAALARARRARRGGGGRRRADAQGARALARRRGRGPAARPRGAARRRPAALPALDLGARAHAARGRGGAADPRARTARRPAPARVHARGRASRGSTGRGPSWAARRRASCSATRSGCPTCCSRRARRGARRSRDGRVPAGVLAAAPADRAQPRGRALPPDDGGVADAVPVPAPARAVGGVRPRLGPRARRSSSRWSGIGPGRCASTSPDCRASGSRRPPSTGCGPATSSPTTCAPATGWPTGCARRACRARSCRAPRCRERRTSCCSASAPRRPTSSNRSARSTSRPRSPPTAAARRSGCSSGSAGAARRTPGLEAWRAGEPLPPGRAELGGVAGDGLSLDARPGGVLHRARGSERVAGDEEAPRCCSPSPSCSRRGPPGRTSCRTSARRCRPASAPYGVAAADFDGNGRPDVAAANGTRGQRLGLPARRRRAASPRSRPDLTGGRARATSPPATSTATASADLAVAGYADVATAATCASASRQRGFALEGGVLTGPAADSDRRRRPRRRRQDRPRLREPRGPDACTTRSATPPNTGFDDPGASCRRSAHKRAVARRRLHRRRPARHRGDELTTPASVDLWVQNDDGTFAFRPRRAVRCGRQRVSAWPSPTSTRTAASTSPSATTRTTRSCPARAGRRRASSRENAYAAGDGPIGRRDRATSTPTGGPTSPIANQAGKRVTVLLRTAAGFVHDPSSPILTNQAGDWASRPPTSTPTGASDMAVANFDSNTISILLNATPFPPPPPPPPSTSTRTTTACSGRPTATTTTRRSTRARSTSPATASTRTARDGDAPIPALKRTIAYKLGLRQRVHDLLRAEGQARAGGRPGPLRLQGQGLHAQEGEDQGQEERRARLPHQVREGRASSSPATRSRSGYTRRTRRQLPPLHDPLGQAAQADARCLPPGVDDAVKCSAAELRLPAPRASRARRVARRRSRAAGSCADARVRLLIAARRRARARRRVGRHARAAADADRARHDGRGRRGGDRRLHARARAGACRSPRGCGGAVGDRRARRRRASRSSRVAARCARVPDTLGAAARAARRSRRPARPRALVAALRLRSAAARLWVAAAVFGTAAGPALGGALTEAFDWRAIFVFGAPVAALAAAAAVACRARGRARPSRRPTPATSPPAGRAVARRCALAALAAVSAALTGVLFLLVLLLVSGWSMAPLARRGRGLGAAARRARRRARSAAPPATRAAAGCALVGGGVLALAVLPEATLALDHRAAGRSRASAWGSRCRRSRASCCPERTPRRGRRAALDPPRRHHGRARDPRADRGRAARRRGRPRRASAARRWSSTPGCRRSRRSSSPARSSPTSTPPTRATGCARALDAQARALRRRPRGGAASTRR